MKQELLKKGYARLKDERNADKKYIQIQHIAKYQNLGIWGKPESKITPIPSLPTINSEESNNAQAQNVSLNWLKIKCILYRSGEFIAEWGGGTVQL